MVKLQYTYRGMPITPYRPQRRKGPGKATTAVIVVLLVFGLLFGAWKIYSSASDEPQEEQTVQTEQQQVAQQQQQVAQEQPAKPVQKPAETAVAVARSVEPTKEMKAFYDELETLLRGNKLEEARNKLQSFLEKSDPKNANFAYAQSKLAACSNKLLNAGHYKAHKVHTVQRNENLSTIARRYRVSIDSIVEATKLKNANVLHIGDRLLIPVNSWSGKISGQKNLLFVYNSDALVWVISLTQTPEIGVKFPFNPKDQEFWFSCGISSGNWELLKKYIPSNTPFSCE